MEIQSPRARKGAEPPKFSAMFIVANRLDGSLGTKVVLNPGDCMLDGDPDPSPQMGWSPLPDFRPTSIVAKRWMHQDDTWYGDRPQSRGLCVRWGPTFVFLVSVVKRSIFNLFSYPISDKPDA